MAINFNLMNPQEVPHNIQPLGSNPSSSGSDEGIGGLLSGLQDFAGGIGGLLKGSSNTPEYSGTASNTIKNIVGQPQQAGISGQLQQQTELGKSSIFDNANKQLGLHEGDSALNSYLQKANPGLDSNQTPWCAGFVGSVLNSSGLKGTGSLAAKSYLNYGKPTQTPTQGDIVVFNDLTGQNRPEHGHVGFIQSINKDGTVSVLGGNQGNSVSIKNYPVSMVAGYRHPPTGQEVQQFAENNGIQSPRQLAEIPKQINSKQMSAGPIQASQLVQQGSLAYKEPNGLDFAAMYKNDELPHVMSAIAENETPGSKNPYQEITRAGGGRAAVGKYQIMDFNVPSWTKEALGRPMSAAQFRNDPEAQEKTAAFKINQYIQKYGPSGAARAWFGGEGGMHNDNAKDVLGTTVKKYENNFNKSYLRSKYGHSSNDPVPKYNDSLINPPQVPLEKLDEIKRELDNGHDDYANNNINWNIFNKKQEIV